RSREREDRPEQAGEARRGRSRTRRRRRSRTRRRPWTWRGRGRGRGQRDKEKTRRQRFDHYTKEGNYKWHPKEQLNYVWVKYTDHPEGNPVAYYHPKRVPSKFHPQMDNRGIKCDDSGRREKSPKRKPIEASEGKSATKKKPSKAPSSSSRGEGRQQ
ncbi:hypothetical protein THAOC_17165, partial [Thalassiosira oceanica]